MPLEEDLAAKKHHLHRQGCSCKTCLKSVCSASLLVPPAPGSFRTWYRAVEPAVATQVLPSPDLMHTVDAYLVAWLITAGSHDHQPSRSRPLVAMACSCDRRPCGRLPLKCCDKSCQAASVQCRSPLAIVSRRTLVEAQKGSTCMSAWQM